MRKKQPRNAPQKSEFKFNAKKAAKQLSLLPFTLHRLRAALNELSLLCAIDADSWWKNIKTGRRFKRNKGELLMLAVSELAEAMEGERKDLMDDKLPHRRMAEVEIADCFIRLFDYAGHHGYDIGGALIEKRAYNLVRPDHKLKARLSKHGKKF